MGMILSSILTGAAPMPAAAAVGTITGNSGHGQQLTAALGQLVISPARASVHVGMSRTYTAEGYNSAGHDLGDVTSATQFSIGPDGSCAGSHCTAATAGRHTITGAVRVHNRVITGTADLQVVDSRPAQPPTGSASGDSGGGQPPSGAGTPSGDRQPTGPQTGHTQHGARLVLRPGRAFMRSGGSITYVAEAFDAANHDLGDVTSRTTFSISFSAAKSNVRARPDGSCANARCTAVKLGRHTVTGTADLGNGAITGTAALQVVPRRWRVGPPHGPPNGPPPQLATLELHPTSAVIDSGARQTYKALGFDAAHHPLGDVTRFTHFKIGPDGSCHRDWCAATATRPLMHTVTGTIFLKKRQVTGFASLLVVPRVVDFFLQPKFKVISVKDSVAYSAEGVIAPDVDVDLTLYTKFEITQPPGFCAANICSASKPGRYTVTGSVDLGDRTLTAFATLVVRPLVLRLFPGVATVGAGDRVVYRAGVYDADNRFVADVTSVTRFRISPGPPGACPGQRNVCFATERGPYTVTGTATFDGVVLVGRAKLIVGRGPLVLRLFPGDATVGAGDRVVYRAGVYDADNRFVADVTSVTRFRISPGPPGACPGQRNVCFATERGPYTVTGTATFEGRTLPGTATLRVRGTSPPPPPISLAVAPDRMVIKAGRSVRYSAEAEGANGKPVADLTGKSNFTISRGDSCTGNSCTATKLGVHIVTATADFRGHTITGKAKLLVVTDTVIDVGLSPKSAVIKSGESIGYTTTGTEANGHGPVKLTGFTSFSISPDGSCAGATCTATKLGPHTVTASVNLASGQITRTARLLVVADTVIGLGLTPELATIKPGERVVYSTTGTEENGRGPVKLTRFTSFSVSPDGSCAGTVCTATKLGPHVVTATVHLASSKVTRTAQLLVSTNPQCAPSPRDVIRKLQVSPRKGPPGTRVHVTARLDKKFAHCPMTFLLGGSRFGGATIQPDGSVSLPGTLPKDAKPGVTQIKLWSKDSRLILGTTAFDVTSVGPWQRIPLWLRAALALLLLAIVLAAVTGDRSRRQRRWVRHHVRAEPHPSAEDVTADREAEAGPGFSVRVQPHAGIGVTEIHKEGD
jgi:hypothetical protein